MIHADLLFFFTLNRIVIYKYDKISKSSLLRHLTVVGQMLHLLYMVYCETMKGMRW